MSDLFSTGIRPAVDEYLRKKAQEERDYGEYWSASSAGYCMRKVIFDHLKVPKVKDDARKTRVFESGHIFHEWMQRITKDAGLSVAQELELQDEDLMIRGHFDDLVIVERELEPGGIVPVPEGVNEAAAIKDAKSHLILYDYKTQNSGAFSYQKGRPMSYYHRMQLGTYMYMIRSESFSPMQGLTPIVYDLAALTEARILKISKDDLRMSEQQLIWSLELESDVEKYWGVLNGHWKAKTLPECTCANHEGGFLAKEAYNDYFYNGEPCSIEWAKSKVDLTKWKY